MGTLQAPTFWHGLLITLSNCRHFAIFWSRYLADTSCPVMVWVSGSGTSCCFKRQIADHAASPLHSRFAHSLLRSCMLCNPPAQPLKQPSSAPLCHPRLNNMATETKKAAAKPKAAPTHPNFTDMTKEAIVALKEVRVGNAGRLVFDLPQQQRLASPHASQPATTRWPRGSACSSHVL